ncbi:sigma-70 family RNA polymerase sigma factor [Sphingomonas koreensis]|nr:sigma-70 family RNA polymerase sigma factor [Sphingomonas koreensis]
MDRVTLGDIPTFREIFRRTSPKLFGICLSILTERSEAEDALQEIYVLIWRRAALYDETRGAAMSWMMTIARNSSIDRLRRSGRIITAPIEQADQIADSDPLACEIQGPNEKLRQLSEGFRTIDPYDALLIRTAFCQGSTYAELALRTGMPLDTIKRRVRRSLPKLASCFP